MCRYPTIQVIKLNEFIFFKLLMVLMSWCSCVSLSLLLWFLVLDPDFWFFGFWFRFDVWKQRVLLWMCMIWLLCFWIAGFFGSYGADSSEVTSIWWIWGYTFRGQGHTWKTNWEDIFTYSVALRIGCFKQRKYLYVMWEVKIPSRRIYFFCAGFLSSHY